MSTRFPFIISISIVSLGIFIYILHLFNLATPANEVYARFVAQGTFIVAFGLLGWQKAKDHRFSWDDLYKNTTLISITLTILLVSSFFYAKIGFFAIGFFAGVALLHALYTKKFYPPNKFFYFVFLYALLQFFGTIGTEKGFHFPDRTLSFYILPLSLCCFRLSKETLFRIAEIFFRTGILFLAICVLYWWYNFQHLDVDFFGWITEKNAYSAEMLGWKNQEKILNRHWFGESGGRVTTVFSAYFFVNSWAYNYHPTFVALILFFGLITGFYLFHKQYNTSTITKFEIILYVVLCFFVIILMESRVGVIGFFFIIATTGLYYMKVRKRHFKLIFTIYLLLGIGGMYVLNDTTPKLVDDDIRDAYRDIAISYIQNHIWWGSGFRQEQIVLESQAETMKDELLESVYPHVNSRIFHSHNQFLGDMVQFGIWGLIVLVAMLAAIAYYAIKNRSYLLQMFMCIILMFMLIDELLYVQTGTIYFAVFLVFFTAMSESQKKTLNREKIKK